MWFLATSFLFLTTFFLAPFFFDLRKCQYQNSEKKQFLGFSRINLCLFNPSLPGLVSLLILNHCKLLPLSFVFIFFLSFFLSLPQEISPGLKCYLSRNAEPRAGLWHLLEWPSCWSSWGPQVPCRWPHLHPSVNRSPTRHPHRWASSSQTGSWTGTCAPQSWDHALLHPPVQRCSFHLVPARRKKGKSKTEIEWTAAKGAEI